MAIFSDRDDPRMMIDKQRQNSIYYRKLFISGRMVHLGFLFLYTVGGNSFHIIKDSKETYCDKKINRDRKMQSEALVFEKLSMVKDQKIKGKYINKRELCIGCQKNILGLYSKGKKGKKTREAYKNCDKIFQIPHDYLFLDHRLVDLLIYPGYDFVPRLSSIEEILNLPYNIKLVMPA